MDMRIIYDMGDQLSCENDSSYRALPMIGDMIYVVFIDPAYSNVSFRQL